MIVYVSFHVLQTIKDKMIRSEHFFDIKCKIFSEKYVAFDKPRYTCDILINYLNCIYKVMLKTVFVREVFQNSRFVFPCVFSWYFDSLKVCHFIYNKPDQTLMSLFIICKATLIPSNYYSLFCINTKLRIVNRYCRCV